MSPFLSNQALQACPHIRGELCHRITGGYAARKGQRRLGGVSYSDCVLMSLNGLHQILTPPP